MEDNDKDDLANDTEEEESDSGVEEEYSGDEEEEGEEDANGDDWESEEEDEDDLLEASDSDICDEAERCPICLNRFRDQDVGTPESCDHNFCLECLQEWAKNVNTCPADRQVFRLILCKHAGEDRIYKKIPVEDCNAQAEEDGDEEEEATYCEVCNECTREDRLLLCDGCDKGYHLDCLTPPLRRVPVNEWFCPGCARREDEESEEEVIPHRPQRQIPRTRAMERVRTAIEELRVTRMRRIQRIPSSSEEEEEEDDDDQDETFDPEAATVSPKPAVSRTKSSSVTKKATPKKRKATTKKRTGRVYKKRKTKRRRRKRKTGKKTTKKGRKVKTKRRTVRPPTVKSVKTRIAGALGLSSPPAGRTIPMQKKQADKSFDMKKADIGASTLSIFGSRDELIHFDDDNEEPRHGKYSKGALSSYMPLGRVPAIAPVKKKKLKVVVSSSSPAASSSTCGGGGVLDLLGSILEGQNKLNLASKDVTIQRDGSLTSKQKDMFLAKATKTSSSVSSSSSSFKSSFASVRGSAGGTVAVFTALSNTTAGKKEEEYDPAHPTDEGEENPGHVDEGAGNPVTGADQSEDEYDPAHPTDEVEHSDNESTGTGNVNMEGKHVTEGNDAIDKDVDYKICNNDDHDNNTASTSCKAKDNISENVDADKCDGFKGSNPSKRRSSEKSDDVKELASGILKGGGKNKAKTFGDSAYGDKHAGNAQRGNDKDMASSASDKNISPKKESNVGEKKESVLKLSPSVKITETGKKVSPTVKPFEISRKTLYEKKRLYGGEIDFTEDVTFSEGGFPENFEASVRRIEEVFKDTKKELEEKKYIPKIVEDKKPEKKEVDENPEFSAKFKPISSEPENNETEKESVSEKFKVINEDTKDSLTSLEEEDPIHEMRKLDKELDLELENPNVGKKKEKSSKNERDREHKKSKRKVSIEGEDNKYRRDSIERKSYDEIEEGEVEDEYKYRERKKKEKKEKKRKAEKEKYYDGEIENADGEIDTRIVIQVSQNTDNRTVWEEDEKIKRKRDREERRKARDKSRERDSKKGRKRRRRRSRSRSRSKSRERRRSRTRSRDRSRRKYRDRSKSHSRDRSYERSRKKKKKERDRSRERRKRSREISEERVDIFGRSYSPIKRRDVKESDNFSVTPTKVSALKHRSDEGYVVPVKKTKVRAEAVASEEKPAKIEIVTSIEMKDGREVEVIEIDDKDDDYSDEPEETEQFHYTDRDEYLSQNKNKQQHQNLIQIGVDNGSYDPADPTESSSPAPPPLPASSPTPPLPPIAEFPPQFPPPPPGPPPPGPPPPAMLIQERPPVSVQIGGPPGPPRMLGEGAILIQRPPPPLERPPPPMMQQRPNINMPMGNLNMLPPPGFHQGLPQTIRPQRQILVRPGVPRMQRALPNPDVPPFGWQEVMPNQFESPARLPGPPLMNRPPFEGMPPQIEGPPPNLPPGHPQFVPRSLAGRERPQMMPMPNDGPPNLVQVPVEMDESRRPPPTHLRPPGPGPRIMHIGHSGPDQHPRLPIPLLPTSEPPPRSVMVSMPPPDSILMSMPPPVSNLARSVNAFPQSDSPTDSMPIGAILRRVDTPPSSVQSIPGLDIVNSPVMANGIAADQNGQNRPDKAFSQLEEISKLLSTQAKLMLASRDKTFQNNPPNDIDSRDKDKDVFKVPLPPGSKVSNSKTDVETTEVVDMDMASPIDEEGNIELPVSPQFDNLLDNTDDWLEEVFNKKTQKNIEKEKELRNIEKEKEMRNIEKEKELRNNEKEKEKKLERDIIKEKPVTPTKEKMSITPTKEKQSITPIKEKSSSTPTKITKDKEVDIFKKESPRKTEKTKKSSKENKPRHHHSQHGRKHRAKTEVDKDKVDIKQAALTDAQFDMECQDLPSSAVELTNKEKYLKKLHLQERVVEEVKMAIKPHYANKKVTKDQYKEILRKAVPKICHSKSGDINPNKIKNLVEAYVDKYIKSKHHAHVSSPELMENGERGKTKKPL